MDIIYENPILRHYILLMAKSDCYVSFSVKVRIVNSIPHTPSAAFVPHLVQWYAARTTFQAVGGL